MVDFAIRALFGSVIGDSSSSFSSVSLASTGSPTTSTASSVVEIPGGSIATLGITIPFVGTTPLISVLPIISASTAFTLRILIDARLMVPEPRS